MHTDPLAMALDAILYNKNLSVVFQPIVRLRDQAIYGYEGLVRGPSNSILHSPTMLFDTALRCNKTVELDFLCRELVIRQFAKLALPGRLFVNVNPVSMLHNSFLNGETLKLIEGNGMAAPRIIIELTETHPVDDVELMQQAIAHYRGMGFRVALDDLGAGYSGLKTWSEILPDFVKIDRHFIQGVDTDKTKQKFIKTILETASVMGGQVIAEGVETEAEYATLRNLGAGYLQGYYFARPQHLPPTELSPSLFRADLVRDKRRNEEITVASLIRPVATATVSATVLEVGEMFTQMPDIESIIVTNGQEVQGVLIRKEFMNMYASRYGKDLYGRQHVYRFMNRNILQVDMAMSLEEVSYRLTSALDSYTDEFVIMDNCRLVGKASLIELLHAITDLKITQARHANPLTLLPGNVPIHQRLESCFREQSPFAVCYFDLDNFKPFNDIYGFAKGDEVIVFLAELLKESLSRPGEFVGHIGGDDFVGIIHLEGWRERIERLVGQFDQGIGRFYDLDAKEGALLTQDRKGNLQIFECMTISVGAVLVKDPILAMDICFSEEAAFSKHQAKSMEGNSIYAHEVSPLNLKKSGPEPEQHNRGALWPNPHLRAAVEEIA